MDPISNVDQLVLLLRQRLEARAAGVKTMRSGKAGDAKSRQIGESGAAMIAALAGVEALDDRQFHRALIQNILVEKFGQRVVNEAQFQQMVDRVTTLIETDDAARLVLARVADDLRATVRK